MEKELSEITRNEWIAFNWIEAPAPLGSNDRIFVAESRRSPDEAGQAAIDWDSTADAREEFKDVEL